MRIIRLLLLTLLVLAISATSFAQFAVSISIAPPALPVYAQPMAPADGYIWTPGYWAYGDQGYFWVPGTWVMAPEIGLLWTPGYWGWGESGYAWNEGYWGAQVGFYGGVDYGYGYGGVGYEGGYWNHGSFYYNRSVNNIGGGNFHNVYSRTVHNTAFNHVSYNGGRGGITARPTQAQEAVSHEQHRQPTAMQTQHVQAARGNHDLLASVNRGRPAIAATAKPGELSGRGVVAARQAGAPYKAAENRTATNSTARSGNGVAHSQPSSRPQTAQRIESPTQSVNRPASATHEQPQARQQFEPRPQAQSMNRPLAAVREQPQAHQQSAPRAQPQNMSRPAPAERSQPAARQESASRPQAQPHAQAQPRAQSAPHSEGKAR